MVYTFLTLLLMFLYINLLLHFPRIDNLNLLKLLIFQKQILNLPDIINDNLGLGVHPSVIAVIQLPITDVYALKEDRDIYWGDLRQFVVSWLGVNYFSARLLLAFSAGTFEFVSRKVDILSGRVHVIYNRGFLVYWTYQMLLLPTQ